MLQLMRRLALLLILPLMVAPALATAKAKTTKSHKTTSSKKAKKPTKAKTTAGKVKSDMESRALIRKKAPLYFKQAERTEIVRINKDGTFSLEGELGATSRGSWRVKQGKIVLKWTTGEEHGYKVTFAGTTPVVEGTKANKAGQYILN
ncbi:MAG: hypothetical protein KF799_01890 [Bdellovibrionales bacterium]|nr:hypothetical protein [Bdellovibrionales bacterium]